MKRNGKPNTNGKAKPFLPPPEAVVVAGKPGAGRPSHLTPERLEAVRIGFETHPMAKDALRLARVEYQTYFGWRRRAEKEGGLYAELLEVVRLAKLVFERKRLQSIIEATKVTEEKTVTITNSPKGGETKQTKIITRPGDWHAAAWLLERTSPEKFGPKIETKHSGEISLAHALIQIRDGARDAKKVDAEVLEG